MRHQPASSDITLSRVLPGPADWSWVTEPRSVWRRSALQRSPASGLLLGVAHQPELLSETFHEGRPVEYLYLFYYIIPVSCTYNQIFIKIFWKYTRYFLNFVNIHDIHNFVGSVLLDIIFEERIVSVSSHR